VLLRPLLIQELEESELTTKYASLDLNEEMMRKDLIELGITDKY